MRRIINHTLITVPEGAVSMLVEHSSTNDREDKSKLYILEDTKWTDQYNEWRSASVKVLSQET